MCKLLDEIKEKSVVFDNPLYRVSSLTENKRLDGCEKFKFRMFVRLKLIHKKSTEIVYENIL